MSWHKTKRGDYFSEMNSSSCCGQETVANRDERKEISNEDDHQNRSKINTFSTGDKGAMNVESNFYQRTTKRFITDLEENKGDPSKNITTQLSGITKSTEIGDTFLKFKFSGGNEDATQDAVGAQTFSSIGVIKNQARNIEIQNNNLETKRESRYSGTTCTKTAKCSCGKTFSVKEDVLSHVMLSCPVSLCFRVELDIKVNRIIDQWKSEVARISGRKWWHLYKTRGFPSSGLSFPEYALDDIELVINEFIHNSCNKKLFDKNGNCFVLIDGLEDLPSEACLCP